MENGSLVNTNMCCILSHLVHVCLFTLCPKKFHCIKNYHKTIPIELVVAQIQMQDLTDAIYW